MDTKKLINSFTNFLQTKNIDRPTLITILQDTFKCMLAHQFHTDNTDHFDVIINIDKGDLQLFRRRTIVADTPVNDTQIALQDARKIAEDFEIGEEVAEEIPFKKFGRRAIEKGHRALEQKIDAQENIQLHDRYTQQIGRLITAEVKQIFPSRVILADDDKNELILPKSNQIPNEYFKIGGYVRAIIQEVTLRHHQPRIILSRTTPLLLEKLLETEIPEIFDGLIAIKAVVREPGERAKVIVESYDDRIDPVGPCIGVKGTRIQALSRELCNEAIEIIGHTDNFEHYVSRALNLEENQISQIQITPNDRIQLHLKSADDISLAIGRNGYNIKLASQLLGRAIDIFREGNALKDTDATPATH